MVQLHPKYGYPLLTPAQKAEILAHVDNGLSSPQIREIMGLKYPQQLAGVLAGRTRALRALANAEGDDDEAGEADETEGVDDAAAFVDRSDVLRRGEGAGVVYAPSIPAIPRI
jgi:hypothetical protein